MLVMRGADKTGSVALAAAVYGQKTTGVEIW